MYIARFGESVSQHLLESLQFRLLRAPLELHGNWRIVTNQLVENHSHRLAQVHGTVFASRGDPPQRMAVTDVFFSQAVLFAAEEDGERLAAGPPVLRSGFEAPQEPGNFAALRVGGANYNRRVCDRRGNGIEFFSGRNQLAGPYGAARFVHCDPVRLHQAEIEESEVGHRPGRRSDIQRIAGPDQDDRNRKQRNYYLSCTSSR